MKNDMKAVLNQFMDLFGTLSKERPEEMQAFSSFLNSVMKDGALSAKTKELISLALSIQARCQYCIALHTKNAIGSGATKEEIIETSLVAALMGGGPAIAHIRYVIDALSDFSASIG